MNLLEQVTDALSKVNDPELRHPITELGMIEDLSENQGYRFKGFVNNCSMSHAGSENRSAPKSEARLRRCRINQRKWRASGSLCDASRSSGAGAVESIALHIGG